MLALGHRFKGRGTTRNYPLLNDVKALKMCNPSFSSNMKIYK